jgi:predicted glycogen debranching enzyme
MGYIKFDKQQLINLEYSLNRELLRTNRAGSYSNTTIIGCNTRKYHGLLVCPMEDIDNDNHVLLSALDVSVVQNNVAFNLGVRKYPGNVYEPKGHKYVRDFEVDNIPKLVYRVGGVVLQMERILSEDDRVMVKYTLIDAHSETKLIFKPFLAFRNVHRLSKANLFVNTNYTTVKNGIKFRMYDGYKPIYMQFNKNIEYVHVPDWYYNVEYQEEQNRGYEYHEDLFVPGFFEVNIKKSESIIFTASLEEIQPTAIVRKFNNILKNRLPRESYIACLRSAAQQFIYKRNGKTEVFAGFPWFGRWGRDTFIALPGLTLYNGDVKTCKDVLNTMTAELTDGLFPNIGTRETSVMNSVDAPLWFFWTLQEYLKFTNNKKAIWTDFGSKMKHILENYRNGTHYNIKMHDNGLIWAGEVGMALTWMDAVVGGKPVTPRHGFDVEINALWYNAIMFSLDLAQENNDKKFVDEWSYIPEMIQLSFIENFWDEEKKYLADYVTYDFKDFSVRPNQVFACSLPYTMISDTIKERVLELVRKVLLTPKGIRTLSPNDPQYVGIYEGSHEQRDNAYHQGTVWPWILGHFSDAYLQVHQKSGLSMVEKIFSSFEEDMTMNGIGTISEIYDGNPPYYARGAISQAWSVAELIRIYDLIETYKSLE